MISKPNLKQEKLKRQILFYQTQSETKKSLAIKQSAEMRSTMKTVTNNVKPKSGKPNKHQQFVAAAIASAKVPKAPVDLEKKALKAALKAAYVARKTGGNLAVDAATTLLTKASHVDRAAARRKKYTVAED